MGDYTSFEISTDMTQEKLDEINKAVEEQKRQEERQEELDIQKEQTNAINEQTKNDEEFYNTITSDSYDEDKADNTLTGITGSSDNIDDSQYTGLFSAIFGKFSDIINGDYSTVESISYPIPNTDKKITITSDILSSKIKDTFIYVFLQSFWLFLFGMYIFKFSNNLIRKIKDGSILNGYENSNEVITSTML